MTINVVKYLKVIIEFYYIYYTYANIFKIKKVIIEPKIMD
jgi:hypothetical protein